VSDIEGPELAALVSSGVLLLTAAALRAAGASLVRAPRADALHDAHEGNVRAKRVAVLLDDRPRLQPALGMVHSTMLVAAAVPASWALIRLLDGGSLAAALVSLGAVLLFFGDFLPRSWGRRSPRRLAYRFSRLLTWAVWWGGAASDLIHDEEDDDFDQDDHDAQEAELIESVLDVTDAVVREVMVPRPDMVVVSADVDTTAAIEVCIGEGRSRIPVTRDSVDDVVGIVYARDLLQLLAVGSAPRPVTDVARPAHFVPETKRVLDLLEEMQAEQDHMAIVVDEFGAIAGLVTIEDLLEELVGEIADEYDQEEVLVRALGGGEYLVDGRLPVDELEELVGVAFPDEDWDTVGGLVLGLAGRVLREGEVVDYNGVALAVERVQGRRVAQVRIGRT